jgi:protein-S-isoprenylcysteine O-methyltransferase Ste14
MSTKIKKVVTPVAWLAYLAIGFEILYMISPFALYYYSTYGPSLNFLHNWPQTAWLSRFFLPHFTESSSWLLSSPHSVGWKIFYAGLILFLVGAGQIYYAKFAKKGAVTGGLYRFVRNPQYTAFAMMGLGLLFIWPRFLVLAMYVTMLFVYSWLARHEEKECAEKFGESFKAYAASTPMFIPLKISWWDKLPALPSSGFKRVAANLCLYLIVMAFAVLLALGWRNYALTTISTFYSQDAATIATAKMPPEEMEKALQLALNHPQVQSQLASMGYGAGAKLLNYLVPLSWFLPDLPLEKMPEGTHRGHHQPNTFNPDEWKVLFTKAKLVGDKSVADADIIKNAVGRIPIVVVKLNKASGEILGIETPPPHVRWGDIPTPLF